MRKKSKNFIFICKLSWKISPYLFFSKLLDLILKTVPPFFYVLFPKYIIDALTKGEGYKKTFAWLIAFLGCIALFKIFDIFTRPYRTKCINRSDIDTVRHYQYLSMAMDYEKLEDAGMRDLKEVVMGRVRGNTAVNFLADFISRLLQLIGFSAILFTLSPYLVLLIAIVIILEAFTSYKRAKLESQTIPNFKRNYRRFHYIDNAMTHFSFAKEIRINQADIFLEQKYDENAKERWKLDTDYNRSLFGWNSLSAFIGFLQTIISYAYSAYEVIKGEITLGSFSMYLGSINNITGAFSGVMDSIFQIDQDLNFVDQYYEFCRRMNESTRVEGRKEEIPKEPYIIAFENVSFRYPKTEQMVLRNVNLILQPGERLSVVGPNGAGKTTFIKLLCRLYVPTEGKITLNGIDIREFKQEEYAKLLAVVFQDYRLFSFHVEENICLNLPTEESILWKVVEKADLNDKIRSLPEGFHTFMNKEFDEQGVEFSGGEAQKVVLARAYYRNSPFVILDEPTSAMDPIAELKLYEKYNEVTKEKTAIFISHRLASTRFCNRIVVFSDGQIVEQGTHKELMERKGLYCEMFQTQASLYQKEA